LKGFNGSKIVHLHLTQKKENEEREESDDKDVDIVEENEVKLRNVCVWLNPRIRSMSEKIAHSAE
jgi:hypothetical protein